MIYADYNATTPLGDDARLAMTAAFEVWGNPSSAHQVGRRANQLLGESREKVAKAAGVGRDQVVFTSGGSEANTLALMGSVFAQPRPFRLVTSDIEHSSVRDTAKWLQKEGVSVLSLSITRQGQLDLSQLKQILESAEPSLVSIMAANNETGVILPVPEIAALCKAFGVALHVDAVQTFGKLSPQFWNSADYVSISSHKIYGPKGVGALLLPTGKTLTPTHFGGAQEIKRRGGTENFLGIVGFAAACAALAPIESLSVVTALRDHFEERLLSEIEEVTIQGAESPRLPNTSNIRFCGISSEILLSAFDLDGLCVSAGSACSSGSISPSHVLLAMGLNPVEAKECLRFSWGKGTTPEQVDSAADIVIEHVKRIRARRKSSS